MEKNSNNQTNIKITELRFFFFFCHFISFYIVIHKNVKSHFFFFFYLFYTNKKSTVFVYSFFLLSTICLTLIQKKKAMKRKIFENACIKQSYFFKVYHLFFFLLHWNKKSSVFEAKTLLLSLNHIFSTYTEWNIF